ncbi:MFS transporter, partial [Pseudomonas aeruginosa]
MKPTPDPSDQAPRHGGAEVLIRTTTRRVPLTPAGTDNKIEVRSMNQHPGTALPSSPVSSFQRWRLQIFAITWLAYA